MENIHNRISRNIKRLLQEKGMTMEGLAFEADIDKGNLSRILSCKQGASLEMLQKISGSLKTDIAEIFKP